VFFAEKKEMFLFCGYQVAAKPEADAGTKLIDVIAISCHH
jgi:hypothetical protein